MKDEPRNRSVWERMKMAFRLLFSVKALEPVYKEGWEDGRRGLYDDYKVMKETIEPFVKGVGGEATNAKILLSALCEKYGIDESKLDEEEKQ